MLIILVATVRVALESHGIDASDHVLSAVTNDNVDERRLELGEIGAAASVLVRDRAMLELPVPWQMTRGDGRRITAIQRAVYGWKRTARTQRSCT